MSDDENPYVFISYSRHDQGYVDELISHLNDAGVATWVDHAIDYGARWPRVIRDAVDGCVALVVVMTPQSEDSEWVDREIARAQKQRKLILPLLLGGEHEFFTLGRLHYEDVSDGRMPSPRFVKRLTHVTSAVAPAEPGGEDSPKTAADWGDEGYRLAESDQWEAALAAYDRAIELDPTNPEYHQGRGWSLNNLERYEAALAEYDRAIALDPDDPYLHAYGRGGVFAAMGEWEAVLTAFDRAIELDPNDLDLHDERANVLGVLRRDKEQLAAYDRAIKLDPTDPVLHYKRSLILDVLGRRRRALSAIDRAIELDPTDADFHSHRGDILRELGRHKAALAAYDRAIELDPTNADLLDARGDTLGELGRHHEALAAYDRAIELDPTSTYHHYGRADALLALGREEEARAAMRQADPERSARLRKLIRQEPAGEPGSVERPD